MYTHLKKLAAMTVPVLLSALLSACGGAPTGEQSNNQSSATNKPTQPSSIESSSAQSSVMQSSISSPAATSASTTSAAASSLTKSSTDSYSRVSRTSSSAASSSSLAVTPETDSIPPTTTTLLLYRLSESSITLIWDEAIDNVGVSHYEIERDGQLVASVDQSINVLSDQQLFAYTDYNYTIVAIDAAGNRSDKSPILNVRTLANTNSSHANSSVSRSSNSSKSTSSVSNSTSSQKSAKLTWTHPTQRENGQYLELDDIGGYEIRYRKTTDKRFSYIVINNNQTTEYTHADVSDTEFEISVFDTNGVYSRFVKVAQ
jgi:chitodextrinase